MIQDIYLKEPKWHVRVYYADTDYYADEILSDLIRIGCMGKKLKDAEDSLWRGAKNSGFTFNNGNECVMVIGTASSGAEFENTMFHEKMHLLAYISESLGIDPYGEHICYIGGELTKQMHPYAKHYVCDCCGTKRIVS